MSHVDAVVVGGSLVGTAAALFLQGKGIPATVYEAHPYAHTRSGGVIGLEHPALQALEAAGVPQHEIIPVPTETVLSVTLSGGVELARQTSLYPGRTTTWSRLYGAIVGRLAEGTYYPDHRLYDVTQDGARARLHFTNGTSRTADLVIFADGRNSVGRKLFDPGRTLHYAGYVAHAGEYPDCPADLAESFVRLHTPGGVFNTFPLALQDGAPVALDWRLYLNQTASLYTSHFGRPPDELTYIPPAKVTDTVRRFVDAAVKKLRLPTRERDIVADTVTRSAAPVLDTAPPTQMVWPVGNSRVVIVGDGVGPVHPNTARGANAGLEQVADLSVALHQHVHRSADLDAALIAWQRRQLPPVRCALREGPILGARMGLGVFGHGPGNL